MNVSLTQQSTYQGVDPLPTLVLEDPEVHPHPLWTLPPPSEVNYAEHVFVQNGMDIELNTTPNLADRDQREFITE